MLNLKKNKQSVSKMLVIAITSIKEELSVLEYIYKFKISAKEAREYKKWCNHIYYCKSYKTPDNNPL